MNDLRFVIVNSNLPHSVVLKSELDNRVSFDVYQDTEEKNIWGLMEGGKDDLYVYDRCGRLAYYIPFPLSIMTADEGLVPSAILATYFRSPCGDTCDKNGRSSFEEFLNSNTDAPEATTDGEYETVHYQLLLPSNTSEEVLINETTSLENNDIATAENSSNISSSEDFDYDMSNETMDDNVNLTRHHSHNDLQNILHGNETFEEVEDSNSTDSYPNTNIGNTTNYNPFIIDVDHSHSESNETAFEKPKTNTFIPKRKFDRCAEADLSVCKNWSKRRLLRAQTCCESASKSEYCKNFGKKRCKKIRTVLKCCIKTAYVETITTTEMSEQPTMDATTMEVVTVLVPSDVICCKDNSEGRTCYVSSTSSCEDDEFSPERVGPVENVPSESTN